MPRFQIVKEQIRKGHVTITGADRKHIVKSLRLGVGDGITLFDGSGVEHEAVITEIGAKNLVAWVVGSSQSATESTLWITLCQGLTKGAKMDLVVQKSTELGVNRIVPMISERCDVRTTRRVERWRRIAGEAAKQSGRNAPPEVTSPRRFDQCLSIDAESSRGVLFYEGGEYGGNIVGIDRISKDGITGLIALVGPEGGFSGAEVRAAYEAGFHICGLGPRTLRAETAGIVAVTLLQHLFGDLS